MLYQGGTTKANNPVQIKSNNWLSALTTARSYGTFQEADRKISRMVLEGLGMACIVGVPVLMAVANGFGG